MFTLNDAERLALFIAGQEKIAREVAEYEQRAQLEAENRVYQMGHMETPEHKLNRANQNQSIKWTNDEIELTREERGGLSQDEFNALRPQRRLEMYDRAVHDRAQAIAK